MLYHIFFTAAFLLVAPPVTSSSSQCSAVKDKQHCIQRCNGTHCACAPRDRDLTYYTGCTQLCAGRQTCKKITCSAKQCIQSCHGCEMECTRDVEFCSQRCLSGKCTLACAAGRCQQDCSKGDCRLKETDNTQYSTTTFSKPYLALLAACFAMTTVLSSVALCLSCRTMRRRRRNAVYQRLRSAPPSPATSTRGIRDSPGVAIRHSAYEFADDRDRYVRPDAIRISVLPLPEKPV